ncbi:glycosyltransferase family 4 protein [Enhygromyxa salina]|uniref:GDP-mannose-dependent alpha-mannosyltransferase n=1 Tax=Enhygromyxa salina TaxID=215803 RepID=A0A2S9YSK2_9BACT|nr:glycosyltransferase family 1 protein [Enhygromyxa salina]PRQ08019.1 GDP-mannose-dependent alpha-mannosyltransferase [Enhygromyxa salina]
MRAVIVVGNYVNVVDGVALTYQRLVRARVQAGDQVMVVAPGGPALPGPSAATFAPVPSIPVPVQPEYRLALGIPRATRRALEQFEPDLIHVGSPDLAGEAALDFAAAHGIPAVGSYHSEIARYLRFMPVPGVGVLGPLLERGVWAWIRRFYNRCRHVYAPTESMLATLRARGIESELRVWGRGVDPRAFDPARRDISWRRRLGVPDHVPLILFVARLRWEKGLADLAAVLAGLARTPWPHHSAIAGAGPAREALARRCPDTHFLGELHHRELARAYASADLFLYPSTTETFGNVTLEAMASGVPTVCADATGSTELVVPGETGELFAAGDVRAAVEVVGALLRDPDRRHAMGRAARARAQRFSWARSLAQLDAHWNDARRHLAP